jgi:formate dehydrogenase alpha subunit
LDGEITGVVPCKTHEISEGKLCVKGLTAHEFVTHKERLKKPLIRKNGRFEEVEWEEVLEYVASKLGETKERAGPNAIGVISSAKCTNEENYLLMKFTRAVLGTNNIDHCARLCHASTMVGLMNSFGSGAMTNSTTEFESTDCILITGSNTVEQHPLIGMRINRAKENGTKVIVVDPRETLIAKLADLYLRQKPGTDVAWINGMMNVILKEGLHDKEFIEKRTENFEELETTIEGYTPEKVEEITGIPRDKLVEAARTYAKAEKAMIVYSMGITQHSHGTDNVMSVANLAMLTGNVGREGTGVNPLGGQNNVRGACDMGALPNVYSGYQKVASEEVKKRFEDAWGVDLSLDPGLTMLEMIDAAHEGRLKALFIMGENPMMSDPDINHTREALENLDFLVVQDIFPTETSELAHVVLPGASFAEKDGTFTATDRRVQRIRKVIEPIGNSKPDWWIIVELAKKAIGKGFDYDSPEDVMTEISSLTPIYGGMSFERLDNGETLLWPCTDESHKGTKFLHEDRFSRGKGRFHAVEYKESAELPDKDYPYVLTTGRTIFHYHTGTMTRKTKLLDNEMPTGHAEINPEDAKELNIKDEDQIKVKSRRGEIEIKALVTNKVDRGVVFIPFHFAECAANILTNGTLDPVAKIPELKVCAVRIDPLGAEVLGETISENVPLHEERDTGGIGRHE